MKNKLLYAALFACLIGCKTSTIASPQLPQLPEPEAAANVSNIIKDVPRKDIPSGWKEVKQDGWSMFVPSDLKEGSPPKDSTLVFTYKNDNLILLLGVEGTTEKDLKTYAYNFAMDLEEDGAEILTAKEGKIDGNQTVIISFKISETVMAMHFLTLYKNTVYNVGCGIEMSNKDIVKASSEICVKFAKSLKLSSSGALL